MKRTTWSLAALCLLLAIPVLMTARADAQDPKPEVKTLTGEPIDIQCYIGDSTRVGAGHATCAASCMERGLPTGLLVAEKDKEGKDVKQVYLLLDARGKTLKELVGTSFGKQVKATGQLTTKDGMKVLMVDTVAAAN